MLVAAAFGGASTAAERPVTPVVEVEAPASDEAPDEARAGAAFVAVVTVPADPGPATTLADLVEAAPGVRVLRQAGPGSAASVSVRGSTPAQVKVFLDDVPLGRAAFDVVDLSDVPLGAVERIEVHRGGVPPQLGAGAVGGALVLRTRPPSESPSHELSAGFGSFSTRSIDAARSARAGTVGYRVSAHYRGTASDFPYFDDGGTPLRRADDRTHIRRNSDSDAGAVLMRAGHGGSGPRWGVLALAGARARGAPGTYHAESDSARSGSARALLDAHLALPSGPRSEATFGVHAAWLAERLRVPDPWAALGAQDTDDRTRQIGLRTSLVAGVGLHQRLALSASGGFEGFVPADRGGASGAEQRRLLAACAVSDDVYLLGDRLVLTATFRSDLVANRFSRADDAVGARLSAPDDLFLASPRAGVRLGLLEGLSLKANAGRHHRLPAFYELFGRRDRLSGSPDLRPETALNADAGLAFERASWGPVRDLRVEVAGFTSEVTDVVVFVPNSQSALVARNLAAASSRGLELEAALRAPVLGLSLSGSYTRLEAENRSEAPSERGRRLPGRPRDDASVQAAWASGDFEVAHRLTWLAGAFFDTPNFRPVPDQVRLDASLAWRPAPRWRLSAEVTNLLGQRLDEVPYLPGVSPANVRVPISDLAGWPLPGRAVYASLRWTDAA